MTKPYSYRGSLGACYRMMKPIHIKGPPVCYGMAKPIHIYKLTACVLQNDERRSCRGSSGMC
ncbi:hypothetical protein PDJAM_G00013640 [Pangasius djambal]|uniref:Uncharacterized protein n=1 Tax=Pangasius djambal TaxID=1691987 RepID=A0ACC5YLJ0_9TELE|nr:hypothetical protein [Pangasius djambal]